MLYSRCILKIRPYCLDVFWFLENEKWQTADLTGSWNYSSSSSPCWEARSRLWDVVRDVQDFWTKIYQVLNSKKIPKTWNTSGYHNQYNRVDLVHHTSDLCSWMRLHLKSNHLFLHIHVINLHFPVSGSLKSLPFTLWGGQSGGEGGSTFHNRLSGNTVNTDFHGHTSFTRTGAGWIKQPPAKRYSLVQTHHLFSPVYKGHTLLYNHCRNRTLNKDKN